MYVVENRKSHNKSANKVVSKVGKKGHDRSETLLREKEVSERTRTVIGDYEVIDKLGKGGFGAVFAVENLKTGGNFAMNIMSKVGENGKDTSYRDWRNVRNGAGHFYAYEPYANTKSSTSPVKEDSERCLSSRIARVEYFSRKDTSL